MFSKLNTNTDLEESIDTLGGGGSFTVPSDIYELVIKQAYGHVAASGAMAVHLELGVTGRENPYSETIYVTNKNGENFYTRNGKNFPLPGFSIIEDICLITTGSGLSEQPHEDKLVNIWDFESSKFIPKERPVLVDLIGKKFSGGILEIRENKTAKNQSTGKYEPINEERIINNLQKVWDTDSQLTVFEARNDKDPEFWDAWIDKYAGNLQDKYKEVKGGAAAGSAGSSRPSKLKFGNK